MAFRVIDTRCKLLYVETSEPTNLAGTGGGLSAETVQAIRERILGVPQRIASLVTSREMDKRSQSVKVAEKSGRWV